MLQRVDMMAVDDEPQLLGRCSVFTYGVGHMLNDITSSCWYTYLLLYLTEIGLSPRLVIYTHLFVMPLKTRLYKDQPSIV